MFVSFCLFLFVKIRNYRNEVQEGHMTQNTDCFPTVPLINKPKCQRDWRPAEPQVCACVCAALSLSLSLTHAHTKGCEG